MIINYYALYDEVSARFKSPVPFANDNDALRAFRESVKRCEEQPQEGYYHRDMSMYRIGMFDDSTGKFDSSVKLIDNYLGAKAFLCEVKNDA